VSSNDYSRWAIDFREEEAFDELARGLSSEAISRGRALKLTGAAILGGALSVFALADDAEAANKRRRRRRRCRNHCAGCCDPFGHCQSGGRDDRCGHSGAACQRCGHGEVCFRRSCVPGA
jgi:hypothetical protein